MSSLKAVVKGGRIVVDEPTELPDGTVVDLYAAIDEEMDPEELVRLDAALEKSAQEAAAGELRLASEILDRLRATR